MHVCFLKYVIELFIVLFLKRMPNLSCCVPLCLKKVCIQSIFYSFSPFRYRENLHGEREDKESHKEFTAPVGLVFDDPLPFLMCQR